MEFRRVMGEMQTAQQRLSAIEMARLEGVPESATARREYHRLTAEEEETKQLLASLQAQHEILLRQQADGGVTIFLSTHSLEIVQEIADRIGIMDHGRIVSYGTMETLRQQAEMDGSLEDVFLKLTKEFDQEAMPLR